MSDISIPFRALPARCTYQPLVVSVQRQAVATLRRAVETADGPNGSLASHSPLSFRLCANGGARDAALTLQAMGVLPETAVALVADDRYTEAIHLALLGSATSREIAHLLESLLKA